MADSTPVEVLSPFVQDLKRAHKISTPLVAVETLDPQALVYDLAVMYKETGVVLWDIAQGFKGMNEAGKRVKTAIMPKEDKIARRPDMNLVEALGMMASDKCPEDAVFIMVNAHRLWDETPILQGIMNLRDHFKRIGAMLVMTHPGITLPVELLQDVMTLDQPLPDDTEIKAILKTTVDAFQASHKDVPDMDVETLRKATNAMRGLAPFPIETSAALCLDKNRRIVARDLWDRKRAYLNGTRGIKVDEGKATFDQIGGLDSIKAYLKQMDKGPDSPEIYVRWDEVEKQMAGFGAASGVGDSSGVTQDIIGMILRAMEDYEWDGAIFIGLPGSGKTLITRSISPTFGKLCLSMDIGAVKNSLVGESEANIRAMLKTLYAAGRERVFIMATCNNIGVMPPELLRRFLSGRWYFDLPTRVEKDSIWPICLTQYGLDPKSTRPNDTKWTGAEIRNVCKVARKLGIDLASAAKKIIPVSQSNPELVSRLREQAHNNYLSASVDGPFVIPDDDEVEAMPMPSRKFSDNRA